MAEGQKSVCGWWRLVVRKSVCECFVNLVRCTVSILQLAQTIRSRVRLKSIAHLEDTFDADDCGYSIYELDTFEEITVAQMQQAEDIIIRSRVVRLQVPCTSEYRSTEGALSRVLSEKFNCKHFNQTSDLCEDRSSTRKTLISVITVVYYSSSTAQDT